MAYIGLAKPTIAKLTESSSDTYSGAFQCGKAIQIDITPNYAEGSVYGDNGTAEYDKEFIDADVSLNTTSLPIEAHEMMFGHTVGEDDSSVTFKGTDDGGYVGFGFYVTAKTNGVRSYEASWLYKVKFSEGASTYRTKGDAIEYQTPTLTGKAMVNSAGIWKDVEIFDTEAEALEWINTKAGNTSPGVGG